VSGTTPDTYTWTDGGGNPVGNTQNLSGIPVGDYSVEVTYNGGTCTQTFGPVSVLPKNTTDGPTADVPLAPSIQCSSFDARWSDEGPGISYRLDVSEDASFTAPLFLTDQAVPASTTTFTVSGLTSGTPYFYRVRSVDGVCVSENSNVISVTTETSDVPSGLYATRTSCDTFTANWAPVPGATDYAVQVATDAAFTSVLTAYDSVAIGSNDNKLSIAGLTGGQTYFYRVTVTTTCGASAYSAAASVSTDGLDATDVPTNLSADPACTTAELSWQAVSGSASRYEIHLDDDEDFANGSPYPTFRRTTTTATTTIMPLPASGTGYSFHVLAILSGCDTTMAAASFTARSEPTAPVVAPLASDDVTCNGFTLSWSAVPDADDYVVHFSKDGFTTFAGDTLTTLSIVLDTLTQGTTYQYRVMARGCTESIFASGTVDTDDIPPGLASPPTATAPTCAGFTVNWTAQPGIRYLVEASPTSDNFSTPSLTETSPEVTGDTYTFSTLAVETSYNYRVITVNDCGEGSPTNGLGPIPTKIADECGCGHDEVAFTVTTSNATCPGTTDGAFTILSRKKPGVTVTPDMGRFKFRYQSLTNPADTSAWEAGDPGAPPLPHFFSGVKAGDYEVLVWDTLGLPGCVDTVAFTTTIGLQNEIRVSAKAETCDSLGQVIVDFPAACDAPDRYYWAQLGSGDIDGDRRRVTISGLSAGDYQVEIFNFFTNEVYDTLSVFVPNTCSTSPEPTTVCNLTGVTFIPETTLAACDTGEGSVTFTSVNNTTETFTFTVIEESGVVFETKEGTSGITFENLPSQRYTYEIYDALSQSCRGRFTVGTKSVVFTASVAGTIACGDALAQVNVAVDTAATLAAGPYEVFLLDQTDTLQRTSLPLGSLTTTFTDVAVGGSYEVVIVAAAEDACVARRTVDATPPGTTALQFAYQVDSATCFAETGSGFVTMTDIVAAEDAPFDALVVDITTGERVQSRKFTITPESFTFAGLPSGQYQILLEQQQNGCATTLQTKRSETFVIDGPSSPLTPSIRSYVEVTVNYPYGTIEIDSIGNLLNGELLKEGAPYEVRIAADPNGGATDWVEVINENPIVRPYRYEYLDQPVGTYFVEVRDRFGCVVQKQVEVGYTAELYIPNIFTPNGDGENDTFQILNLEDFGENAGVQLTVTNRWGRQVYRAKNYTNAEAWDGGSYSDGVYFYHLILPDNTTHTGWVEIWRGRTP
jgi:gliding motility-associated-like protein